MTTVVQIPTAAAIPVAGGVSLHAELAVPLKARGLVLFAQECDIQQSPRNHYVAFTLGAEQLATLVANLLTSEEEERDERRGALKADVELLARRLVELVDWTRTEDRLERLPLALFGSGMGAAAVLDAAALRADVVRAVVCSGGHPDLATHLAAVKAPTLFLAGGKACDVLQRVAMASRRLTCPHEIEVISGATSLFDEPGALEAVTSATGAWLHRYLTHPDPHARAGS